MDRRFFNDEWVLDDAFGIGRTGDLVAQMALEVTPPFTLGVIGKWGSGKTSIMRRAFATLKGNPVAQAVPLGQDDRFEADHEDWGQWAYDAEKRADLLPWSADLHDIAARSLCIWYSPWQHQRADNPLVPLLMEIKAQFAWRFKALNCLDDVARRGALAGITLLERVIDAAVSLNVGKPVKVATGTAEAVTKAWSSADDGLLSLSDGQRFHLLFEDAVETLLASVAPNVVSNAATVQDARIVIFIDDLDRCEETTIVSLLETIKLYLGTKKCVFVLGMDDGAVLGALKRHWKDRDRDGNREYLEKLLQCSLPIPLPQDMDVRESVAAVFAQHKVPENSKISEHVIQLLEPNPRKIKNFVNGFCARWIALEFNKSNPSEADAVLFLICHYIRQYHQPIWRIIERQPWTIGVLVSVLIDTSTSDTSNAPNGDAAIRVMREFMTREFLHVLHGIDQENSDKHRSIPMDRAVEEFLQRIDRKRSDDYLVTLVRDHLTTHSVLEDRFLRLPSKPVTDHEKKAEQ